MNIELLSPAGGMEALDSALMYGADAVYLAGKSFGMRSAAGNFAESELADAINKAHTRGKKVYVTCNTVPRSRELEALGEQLKTLEALGADAVIAADIGVMSMARKLAPSLQLHVSTQTGVANYESARTLYEMGASRVVLARELALEEIAEIRAKTPKELELECFVHGSMCVSFSGRCLLSNYLTNRDANRGECSQPCRWKYHLMEETRDGEYFPIFEDDNGAFILNSRDLCMIEHLPELISAGANSLKIEGRAKTAYYSAVITNAYRICLDGYLTDSNNYKPLQWVLDEVNKVSHRQYSTGFYLGGEPGQIYTNGGYIRDYEVSAVVESCEKGWITAIQRNKFSKGEALELLMPGAKPIEFSVLELRNGDGEPIDSAPHPLMTVKFPLDCAAPKGAYIRKKR